jgi:hypothetical protein
MLRGFIDHWAPSQNNISKFWKSDFETVSQKIAGMKRDIDFNNFTFYTKWFTNGIKSGLPFLRNHSDSSNVKTDNQWGRNLISFLHNQGISIGNMLQLLFFEKDNWGKNNILRTTDECKKYAETEQSEIIADFTQHEYINRVKEIIAEQIAELPGFDYIFLEFEGIRPEDFAKIYAKWAVKNGRPDISHLSYSNDSQQHCKRISQELNIMWSTEGQEMFRQYFASNLKEIHNHLKSINYHGSVGVVHHLYGYESLLYPDILPDRDWWLLPWHYWVFEKPGISDEEINAKKDLSKELLQKWKKDGHRVCYIGDVTLGRYGLEHIDEFYKYCEDIHLDGYLGMGNPDPDIGLRWNDGEQVDTSYIMAARNLYKKLYEYTT